MLIELLVLALSLFILFKSTDILVEKAVKISEIFKISHFAVGAILIGTATSFPELFVSIVSSLQNSTGIVVGNAIGSNIADIALVRGIGSFFGLIIVTNEWVIKNRISLFSLTVLPLIFIALGSIETIGGILLILIFVFYCHNMRKEKITHKKKKRYTLFEKSGTFLLFFAAVAAMIIAAKFAVDSAVALSDILDISHGYIGLTIIAIGTSLPELSVAIVGLRKKYSDLVVGDMMGSCVVQITVVLGVAAIISPFPIVFSGFEIANLFLFGITGFVWFVLARYRRITWKIGLIFLAIYALFLISSALHA
jgi:cation:H+ antiporter